MYVLQVLEPNWVLLEKNLRSVHTIDDVLTAHTDFLDRSLRDCLLSDKEVLKIVSRLMAVCERFTDYLREVDMTQEEHRGKKSLTQRAVIRKRSKSATASGTTVLPSGADPHQLRRHLLSRYTCTYITHHTASHITHPHTSHTFTYHSTTVRLSD